MVMAMIKRLTIIVKELRVAQLRYLWESFEYFLFSYEEENFGLHLVKEETVTYIHKIYI
jgi:hypothetical protein